MPGVSSTLVYLVKEDSFPSIRLAKDEDGVAALASPATSTAPKRHDEDHKHDTS